MLRCNTYPLHRTKGYAMNRFLQWLDKLAEVSPYATFQIFGL